MSDKQLKALESHDEALLYAAECIRAVGHIGGDPATVGELVAALNAIADSGALECGCSPCRQQCYGVETLRGIIVDMNEMARAVLAKLPENSND